MRIFWLVKLNLFHLGFFLSLASFSYRNLLKDLVDPDSDIENIFALDGVSLNFDRKWVRRSHHGRDVNYTNWHTKFKYPSYAWRNIVHSHPYNQYTKHDYLVMFYGTYQEQVLPWYYDYPYDYHYEDDAHWQDKPGKHKAYVVCQRD